MMPLLFRDRANPIREIEGRFEIRKSELFLDVVIVDNLPVLDLGSQRLDLLARQGRRSPSARNTGLLRKSSHGITELSRPAADSVIGHTPSLARRVQRPQRRRSASPAMARTPVFFSQASKSSGKMRVPGSRYGTPFSRGMSYSTPRVTIPL